MGSSSEMLGRYEVRRTLGLLTGSGILAKANPKRVVLVFSNPSVTTVFFSILPISAALDGMYVTTPSNPNLVLTCVLHGILPQLEWYAWDAANSAVNVLEVCEV